MAALAQPEEARVTAQETRADRRRIKELEKDLRRKEKALAETTALLVLRTKTAGDPPGERGRMISREPVRVNVVVACFMRRTEFYERSRLPL